MKNKGVIVVAIILILTLLVSILPGRSPVEAADSYMAIIPEVLHAGSTEELPLALFKREELIPGEVEVALLKKGEEILQAFTWLGNWVFGFGAAVLCTIY